MVINSTSIRWKDAMHRAGYAHATRPESFHFSLLLNPAGDRSAAELAYRDLLNEQPDDKSALEALAYLLELQGRRDEASLCTKGG